MLSADVVSAMNSQAMYSATKAPKSDQTLGKSEFMTLLVTQLRNQNPLEPLDNKDFIAQLSQFSSLEQLEGMRKSIDDQLSLQRSLSQTTAISLLGRQVTLDGSVVPLREGASSVVSYNLDESADVQIEIYDLQGTIVRTLTPGAQPLGDQKVIWDGKDDQGNALPEGNYTYHVLAVGGGDRQVSVQPFFEGRVDGVRLADNGIVVTIAGLEVPISQVKKIE